MTAHQEEIYSAEQHALVQVPVIDEMSEKRASRVSTNQSLSAISEDDLAKVEGTAPMAPDGGYGWVVVCASFLCFFLVDGTIFSMGGFLKEWETHFGCSKSQTAWVVSLMSGCYLLVGPVAGALSNALGCRTVAIIGSLLATTGLVLAQYAKSMEMMYLYAGVMTGIGYGFIFLPAACSISFYFEKKRAFATGVAVCGSGIGGLVLGPIMPMFLDTYGWENSMVILAAIAGAGAFISTLFKPLDTTVVEIIDEEAVEEQCRELRSSRPLINAGANIKNQNGSTPSLDTKDAVLAAKFRSNYELHREGNEGQRKDSIPSSVTTDLQKVASRKMSASRKSVDIYRSKLSIDQGVLRKRGLSVASLSNGERRLTNPDLKPLLRKDIFLNGSLIRVPEYRSQTNISNYHASVIHLPTLLGEDQEQVWGCVPRGFADMLKSILCFDLMRSPSFLLLASSGFLTMMGFYIPFMYLVDAARGAGIEKNKAAYLLSTIGFTNTAGRVFCGWISDMPNVGALMINNIAIMTGGVATILIPHFMGDLFCLHAYAAIFGFAIACFAALRSIIVVELFGLEKLTNGFGLLLLFQGLASLVGAPLAGYLYDRTKAYDVPFYFFGIIVALSGLMCVPINTLLKWERRREDLDTDSSLQEKIKVSTLD